MLHIFFKTPYIETITTTIRIILFLKYNITSIMAEMVNNVENVYIFIYFFLYLC